MEWILWMGLGAVCEWCQGIVRKVFYRIKVKLKFWRNLPSKNLQNQLPFNPRDSFQWMIFLLLLFFCQTIFFYIFIHRRNKISSRADLHPLSVSLYWAKKKNLYSLMCGTSTKMRWVWKFNSAIKSTREWRWQCQGVCRDDFYGLKFNEWNFLALTTFQLIKKLYCDIIYT